LWILPETGFITPLQIYAVTFFTAIVSGMVPFVNIEAYLIGVMSLGKGVTAVELSIVAASGQMTAKSLMYLAGRGVLRIPLGRHKVRLEDLRKRIERSSRAVVPFIFLSALSGIPPFYFVSVLAGTLRWAFPSFLVAGFIGRLLRFAIVAGAPEAVFRLVR
jgi:membrane protein YqaA with SNARE-associated domain